MFNRKGGFVAGCLALLAGIIVLVLAGGVWAVYKAPGMLVPTIEAAISEMFNGRQVTIEKLSYSGEFHLKGLKVADPDKGADLLNISEATLQVGIFKALQGNIVIEELNVDNITVNVDSLKDGTLSIDDLINSSNDNIKTAFSSFSGSNSSVNNKHDYVFQRKDISVKLAAAAPVSEIDGEFKVNTFMVKQIIINLNEIQSDHKAVFKIDNLSGAWDGKNDIELSALITGPGDLNISIKSEKAVSASGSGTYVVEDINLDLTALWKEMKEFARFRKAIESINDGEETANPSKKNGISSLAGVVSGKLSFQSDMSKTITGELSLKSGAVHYDSLQLEGINLNLAMKEGDWNLSRGDFLFAGQAFTCTGKGSLKGGKEPSVKELRFEGHGLDAAAIARSLAPDAPPLPSGFPPAEIKALINPEGASSANLQASAKIPGVNINAEGEVYPDMDVKVRADADLKLIETLLIAFGAPVSSISGELKMDLRVPHLDGTASLSKGSVKPSAEGTPEISRIKAELKSVDGKWNLDSSLFAVSSDISLKGSGEGAAGNVNIHAPKLAMDGVLKTVSTAMPGLLPEGLKIFGSPSARVKIDFDKKEKEVKILAAKWEVSGNNLEFAMPDVPEISQITLKAEGDLSKASGNAQVGRVSGADMRMPVVFDIPSFKPLKAKITVDSTTMTMPLFLAILPEEARKFCRDYNFDGSMKASGDFSMIDSDTDYNLNVNAAGATLKPPMLREKMNIESSGFVSINKNGVAIPDLNMGLRNSKLHMKSDLDFADMSLKRLSLWTQDLYLEDVFKSMQPMPLFVSGKTEIDLNGTGSLSDLKIEGYLRCNDGLLVVPLTENWDAASEGRNLKVQDGSISNDFFRLPFSSFDSRMVLNMLVTDNSQNQSSSMKLSMSIPNFSLKTFRGVVNGSAEIGLMPEISYKVNFKMSGADVQPFLHLNTRMGPDAASGTLGASGTINGIGSDSRDMNGVINYEIDGMVLQTFLPFQKFFKLVKLPALEQMKVQSLKGIIYVRDGALHTDDLFVDSDFLRADGSGSMKFDKQVNAQFKVSFKKGALAGSPYSALPANLFQNRDFEVKVTGPIDSPAISANIEKILLGLIADHALSRILPSSSSGGAAETVQQNAGDAVEKGKDAVGNAIESELDKRIRELEEQISKTPPFLQGLLRKELEKLKGGN